MFVAALFIIAPKLEITQMAVKWWLFKQIVYPYSGILNNKKWWTIDTCNNTDKSQNNYSEWKKPDKKEYTLYSKLQKMKTCL